MRRRAFVGEFLRLTAFLGIASATTVAHGEDVPVSMEPSFEAEAAPRRDRVWPTTTGINTRIEDAFSLMGRVEPEVRDEAATRNGRVVPEVVPLPAATVSDHRPEGEAVPSVAPELRGDQISSYAMPQARPDDQIEAALSKPPVTAIQVPLPKRRPTPPVAGATTGEGEASVDVGRASAPRNDRVATLTPDTSSEAGGRASSVTEPMGEVAVFGEPKTIPKEALPYLAILRREAAAQKVPLWLAIGVGWVESKYNPRLRGTHGVVGIMQVMPSTARFQGYRGTNEQLLDAETNIVWGIRELAWDWQKAGGNACLAIAKYKGGIMTKTIPSAAASYCAAAKRVTGMN